MKNKEMVNITLSAATKQRLFDLMAEKDCTFSELMDMLVAKEERRPELPYISVQVCANTTECMNKTYGYKDLHHVSCGCNKLLAMGNDGLKVVSVGNAPIGHTADTLRLQKIFLN